MLERSGIICAGNWIVDLVHDIEHWPAESDLVRIGRQTRGVGGGAANVIAALAKFETGLPLWPMGAIGDDEFGAFIQHTCQDLGLSSDQLAVKAGIPTAHTHVMSVAGRSRTFFYQAGANDALCADDFPAGTFASTPARLFYLGYLTLLGELDRIGPDGATEAARVLARAQRAGLITCVDLVSAQHGEFERIVAASAPVTDYLIVNEIEAARALGADLGPEQATDPHILLRMGRDLREKGVCKAVVIHCEACAIWSGADGATFVAPVDPLPPGEIASHLGAGDAFCAGILFALHEGWTPEQALDLANAAARASLKGMTATGAIPPLHALQRQLPSR